jgi:hypothetical protein
VTLELTVEVDRTRMNLGQALPRGPGSVITPGIEQLFLAAGATAPTAEPDVARLMQLATEHGWRFTGRMSRPGQTS